MLDWFCSIVYNLQIKNFVQQWHLLKDFVSSVTELENCNYMKNNVYLVQLGLCWFCVCLCVLKFFVYIHRAPEKTQQSSSSNQTWKVSTGKGCRPDWGPPGARCHPRRLLHPYWSRWTQIPARGKNHVHCLQNDF